MSKHAEDPLVAEIRHELMPGRFVKWDAVSAMVVNLNRMHDKVNVLVKAGETERADENSLRLPAMSLKEIYEALGDVSAYAVLCGRLGLSPRDCEHLAQMEIAAKHRAEALGWVERGIALRSTRNWHNEDVYDLARLKPEILRHLGRKQDALALAWDKFEEHPDEFGYEELMRFVPRGEKKAWHERAMAAADDADLDGFISLCVKAKEWERLARRVQASTAVELESLSHFCTEPAAKGLAKEDPLAAARLYRAMGLRIVNAGKSKYYGEALSHFEDARDLYCGAGQGGEWQSLVETVRVAHSRKTGFLSAFERIVSGKSHSSSYAEEAQARWNRLTS